MVVEEMFDLEIDTLKGVLKDKIQKELVNEITKRFNEMFDEVLVIQHKSSTKKTVTVWLRCKKCDKVFETTSMRRIVSHFAMHWYSEVFY